MAQAAHATQTSKTDTYLYRGKDRLGKPVRGEVKSESVALAKAQLRKQGIIAQDLHKKAKPLFGDRKKPIKPADIAVFSRQLATMMKAGVPLVQSFDIVADGQENAAFRQMIVDIRNDVAGEYPGFRARQASTPLRRSVLQPGACRRAVGKAGLNARPGSHVQGKG